MSDEPLMRMPLRLSTHHPLSKWLAAGVIALTSCGLAIGVHRAPGLAMAMSWLDETLYDSFYHLRRPRDRTGDEVLIVAVDDGSLSDEHLMSTHPGLNDRVARVGDQIARSGKGGQGALLPDRFRNNVNIPFVN